MRLGSKITKGAIVGSKKIYINGVPMRDVILTNGKTFPLYDTSGVYTDDNYNIDITKGIKDVRSQWVEDRGDCETILGRQVKPEDNGIRGSVQSSVEQFQRKSNKVRRAKNGKNVSQMHYARNGIITKEMEFIATRENLGRENIAKDIEKYTRFQGGNSFGANLQKGSYFRICKKRGCRR